jgi:hypothetical protein
MCRVGACCLDNSIIVPTDEISAVLVVIRTFARLDFARAFDAIVVVVAACSSKPDDQSWRSVLGLSRAVKWDGHDAADWLL